MERSDDSHKGPAKAADREHISALLDGEADPDGLRAVIAQLREGEGRQAWDLYHQIGDAIRSAEPGPAMRADFSARFAERFAAEPILLPPRRSLMSRLGAWPTTIAAVAAAGFGFFIAPSLMRDASDALPAAATTARSAPATPLLDSPQVAQQVAADNDATLDYIALHHRAHASLYGAAPAMRPAVLDAASHR